MRETENGGDSTESEGEGEGEGGEVGHHDIKYRGKPLQMVGCFGGNQCWKCFPVHVEKRKAFLVRYWWVVYTRVFKGE